MMGSLQRQPPHLDKTHHTSEPVALRLKLFGALHSGDSSGHPQTKLQSTGAE
jgi:hypothetical protein